MNGDVIDDGPANDSGVRISTGEKDWHPRFGLLGSGPELAAGHPRFAFSQDMASLFLVLLLPEVIRMAKRMDAITRKWEHCHSWPGRSSSRLARTRPGHRSHDRAYGVSRSISQVSLGFGTHRLRGALSQL